MGETSRGMAAASLSRGYAGRKAACCSQCQRQWWPVRKPMQDHTVQAKNGNRKGGACCHAGRASGHGDAVLVVPREQPPTNKTNLNTRLMVKQNGRWVMLFSFNTRIEASQAPA